MTRRLVGDASSGLVEFVACYQGRWGGANNRAHWSNPQQQLDLLMLLNFSPKTLVTLPDLLGFLFLPKSRSQ